MKHLMLGAAALALLTACGQDDTPSAVQEQQLSEITVRAGDPAEAEAALTAMALNTSGAGILAFSQKSVSGATATFTDVTIAGQEGFKAGNLLFEGLEVEEDVATFGRMMFSDIVLADPEGAEGEVRVGTIELINPSPELAAWLAGALKVGPEAALPSMDAVSFDKWSISNVTGNFDDDEATGTFGLGSMEIRGLGDLKAARVAFGDLSLNVLDSSEGVNVDMSLSGLQVSNLDTKFLKAVQDNIGDEEALASSIMGLAYENPMDPGYDALSMDNLKIAVAGADFTMPSLNSYVERNAAGQPVRFVTQPYEMTLTADPEGGEAGAGLAQGLSMVGYESVKLKGESAGTYDPDLDIVEFDAASNFLELVDGARFSFGGKIEGYSAYAAEAAQSFDLETLASGGEPDPMAMTAAFGNITIHGFELSIKDDSLVNRVLNLAATQMGQDPEELKSQVTMGISMAPMMAQGSGVDMALVTEASTALSNFVSNPGTLTLKLAPSEPLSIGALMENPDPSALTKDKLGFSAANK